MPWHRAFVLYIENLIDFPIPYWNGFGKNSTVPKSPGAGIPAAFLELEYTHIVTGEVRKNPLRFALAADGMSQGMVGSGPYVRRDPVLEKGPIDPGFAKKVSFFTLYHQQLNLALSQSSFSTPEGFAGSPWENDVHIAQEINPDSLYPSENLLNFDGLLEQVHDNYHGWVGHDMVRIL
jgi:Common central domain of tyrosinase